MNIFDLKGSRYSRQVVPTKDMTYQYQNEHSSRQISMIDETFLNRMSESDKRKSRR